MRGSASALQGVGIAERAFQQALAYAQERRQGRAVGKTRRRARARSSCIPTSSACCCSMRAHDARRRAPSAMPPRSRSTVLSARQATPGCAQRRRRAARCSRRSPRPSPPISASRSPRSACRCMAAWALSRRPARRSTIRDARIAPIYEGTNGIQAIDLVTRKLAANGGAVGVGAARRARGHRQAGGNFERSRPSAPRARKLREALARWSAAASGCWSA